MELIQSLMPASMLQEGLGSGALQEFLDSIDRQAEQIKLGLLASFGEAAQAASSGTSGGVDPALLRAMVALADVAGKPNGPEAYIADYARKYMEVQERVETLEAELKTAQAAADLEATVRGFRASLENGQFVDAAKSVVQLRAIAADARAKSAAAAAAASAASGGWQGSSYYQQQQQQQHSPQHASVDDAEVERLTAACARCEAELDEALEAACQEALDVSAEGGVLTIMAALPSGGDIGDLWAAMELAGLERRHLEWVAAALASHVLPPILAGAARFDAHSSHGGDAAIVKWRAAAADPEPFEQHAAAAAAAGAPPPSGRVEADCAQLLRVVADALLRGRPSTLAAFGAAFWPRFAQLYTRACMQQLEACGAAALRGRQAAAADLEAAARELGMLPAAAADAGEPLAAALGRALAASYHAAQEGYLARARSAAARAGPSEAPVTVGAPLPVDGDFYRRYRDGTAAAWEALEPPAGWDGGGAPLAAGFYAVTPGALEAARVMDDALADAVAAGDASLAQAAVVTVSKAASMFASLVPRPSAAGAPGAALLRRNDLAYLADHMLLLPFLHSPGLERLTGGEVWFGDDALRLRGQARALLNESLSAQQAALAEPLAQLLPLSRAAAAVAEATGGAGSGSRKPAGGESEPARAVRALLHTLERAGRLVWPVLPPAEALEFSARLLGPLSKALADDVLSMTDVSEAECGAVNALLRPLVNGAPAALLSSVDGTGERQGLDAGGLDVKTLLVDALTQRAWGLRRLSAVLALLDARLAEIVARWEAGDLQRAGLALGEVKALVRAVFEDTDLRAQCLQRIDAAAGQ